MSTKYFNKIKSMLKIVTTTLFVLSIVFSGINAFANSSQRPSETLASFIDDEFTVYEGLITLLDVTENDTLIFDEIYTIGIHEPLWSGYPDERTPNSYSWIGVIDTNHGKYLKFDPYPGFIGSTILSYDVCGLVKEEYRYLLPPVNGFPADPDDFCLDNVRMSINMIERTGLELYIVDTDNAKLHVRNEMCEIIDTLPSRARIFKAQESQFTCKIDGVSYEMIGIAEDDKIVYVAKNYIQKVFGTYIEKESLTVNATIGLNIRDENCNIFTAVVDDTVLTTNPGALKALWICYAPKSDGYYYIQPILFNGKRADGISYMAYYGAASYYLE